ncbi:MAG: hypothetical protein FJ109_13785 [Deltaproteobacteria bacterium]|nr:hypothetical protein [Deltaproteobacteria bacterium]
MRYRVCSSLCCLAALAAACSSGGALTVVPDAGEAQDSNSSVETTVTPDLLPEAGLPELHPQEVTAPEETVGPACHPGEGCFLDKCKENADCLSGWCVGHMGEGVCTQECQEECPDGWTCQKVGGGPDLMYICVSLVANLCRPCSTQADCKGDGETESACVSYGEEGSFCGASCGTSEGCPWGFSCKEAVSAEGTKSMQCVADAGICPCTARSVALALSTPCEIGNEWGVCQGKRTCTTEGLAPCDAAVPATESCNGADDDCDGDLDEGTCDDGNLCTKDSCKGQAGCTHEAMTGGNCDDGDSCTVTDHCEEGACVGSAIVCNDNSPCTDDSCDGVSGCTFLPNQEGCDDGDPCTIGDTCKGGKCQGIALPCDCQSDKDCAKYEDGDACNGILFCDQSGVQFQCKVDPKSVVTCPEPTGKNANCLAASCDPASGDCAVVPANPGLACSNGDKCTFGETCLQGACQGGLPLNCNDGDPCTDDSCIQGAGCVHEPNFAPCDDGNSCTAGDKCGSGACIPGAPLDCSDSNPCTNDVCSPLKGCLHTTNTDSCDDQDPCTEGDKCSGGMCVGLTAKDCSDGNPCTDDTCMPLAGCSYKVNPLPCDDGNPCTTGDKCSLGTCVGGKPIDCNDNNPCTKDACDPVLGCTHAPLAGTCDDGNPCTTGDKCDKGICVGTSVMDCDDSNPCTKDICTPNGCAQENLAGPCSDSNTCTVGDQCEAGKCKPGTAMKCNDLNPCTNDSCDPATGCAFVPNEAACNDGNACTAGDTCKAGTCQAGAVGDPDDSNPCTTDKCNAKDGCVFTLNTLPCDDGDACTAGDVCAAGKCSGPKQVSCDDKNSCTQDSCDKLTGCANMPAPGTCTDGNVCTKDDACDAGVCKPGVLLDCDDKNPCTTDYCHPVDGCKYVPTQGPCEDGSACTVGDTCDMGTCKAGTPLACNDGNVCTDDSCDPATGCKYANNTANCDDGSACTTADKCAAGKCVGGSAPNCDDGNQCTTDSCNAQTGCVHTPLSGVACNDGDPNTSNDTCTNGVCKGTGNVCGPNLLTDPLQVKAGWTLCYLNGSASPALKNAPCHQLFNSAGKTYGCWHGHSTYPHQNDNGMVDYACKPGVQNSTTYWSWGGDDHILTVCIQN